MRKVVIFFVLAILSPLFLVSSPAVAENCSYVSSYRNHGHHDHDDHDDECNEPEVISTPSATNSPSVTPTPSVTYSPTAEPTPTVTNSPSPTITVTVEPTSSATESSEPTPTVTVTVTPEPTSTVTATYVPPVVRCKGYKKPVVVPDLKNIADCFIVENTRTYWVQPGDNWNTVGIKFGMTYQASRFLNYRLNALKAGQGIQVGTFTTYGLLLS